ncbi:MAG: hypothetical protein ACETWM_21425 [Candidatus Lokiarchaeia archaeon]
MGVYRPAGVIALSIIIFILAGILIILAIAISTILIPGQQQNYYFALLDIWLYVSYGIGYAVGLSYLMDSPYTYISILNIVFWIALIVSGSSIIMGIGLLTMKNWGRILAMIIGILFMVFGILSLFIIPMGLFGIVGLLLLIFGIFMVVYLAGDVKYEFQ